MSHHHTTPVATNPYACPGTGIRERIPKDGMGPRGAPDVYYTSRVLNSTFRYVKFVKRLRAEEEEYRKGQENNLKNMKDQQISDFFISCDRRALINQVGRRVDLCMLAFEEDLKKKRQKLCEMYRKEEERDIRLFVEQAQAANENIWQEKLARLNFLLAKRKQEHAERYTELPIARESMSWTREKVKDQDEVDDGMDQPKRHWHSHTSKEHKRLFGAGLRWERVNASQAAPCKP